MEGHHHRVGETGLSDSGPSNQHTQYSSVLHGLNSPATTFFNQQGPAFDFGELEEAIVLQGLKLRNDEAKKSFFTTRPAATLEMFPSWPMRIQQTPKGSSKSGGESTDSGSAQNTQFGSESPLSTADIHQVLEQKQHQLQQHQLVKMASDVSRTTTVQQQQSNQQQKILEKSSLTSEEEEELKTQIPKKKRKGAGSSSNKPLDAKTLRRLAQNREAARKSRLRKKAYVQQLETSRVKLSQLEQDLQRARSQGLFLAAGVNAGGNLSSGAAIFDMEYARWLDDDHRHMSELRTGLHSHLQDGDLRLILDAYLSHYDEIFHLKAEAAKSDVFHLINGMWTTPAERCFLWMGGFRPSELLKILMPQLDPLTEQQVMGICNLQQSSQQAEEALSQGLEQLHQSLSETISSGSLVTESSSTNNNNNMNVGNYMGQMALALNKLSNLEGFVRQADNLRHQTLHQMHRILTVRQAARCFLAIGEYYNRLRALSSLWASRPRENLLSDDSSCQTTTELQMIQTPHNHFSSF